MNQRFFNRLLHLVHERPQQSKRMVGMGADALWELWQRIAEAERTERTQQAQRPDRHQLAVDGQVVEPAVSIASHPDLSAAPLDDASDCRDH